MDKHERFTLFLVIVFFILMGLVIAYFIIRPLVTSSAEGVEYAQHNLLLPLAFSENEEDDDNDSPAQDYKYILTVQDGYIVALYSTPESKSGLNPVAHITNIPINPLALVEQALLLQGIPIYSDEELFRALEDFGS